MKTLVPGLSLAALSLLLISAGATVDNGSASAVTRPAILRRHGLVDSHAPSAVAQPTSATAAWADLLAGNHRFVHGQPRPRAFRDARKSLVAAQHPSAIVLGCSDSRVSPELVFDRGLGEVFVIRTAGNVADPVALGSIEYAVEHLHAKLLVVLGHENCGAVAAATSGAPLPSPHLEAIVAHIQPALAAVRADAPREERMRQAVEANVRHTAASLLEQSSLLNAATRDGLEVVRAVYRLESGEVAELH